MPPFALSARLVPQTRLQHSSGSVAPHEQLCNPVAGSTRSWGLNSCHSILVKDRSHRHSPLPQDEWQLSGPLDADACKWVCLSALISHQHVGIHNFQSSNVREISDFSKQTTTYAELYLYILDFPCHLKKP